MSAPAGRDANAGAGTDADRAFMSRALELAALGRYSTHPNPRVGCVLVRDGRVIGEGWHAKAGLPHAEIEAMRDAQGQGESLAGATAYVTLEPCAHHGRTGPCAEALVVAGVGRVVAAMEDPNPLVAGKGFARLRAAGVAVEVGVSSDEARTLNRGFVSRMTRGRPWVTVKMAASLDGRTALADGRSQWITGPAARADVHRLRAEAGAVLVGVGTLMADDPRLTVRDWGFWPAGVDAGLQRQPDRIVLDPLGRAPGGMQAWRGDDGARRFWVTGQESDSIPVSGAESPRMPPDAMPLHAPLLAGTRRLDLAAVFAALGDRQVNHVLVEAGPKLAGAIVTAGQADEIVLYTAPRLLGHQGRPLLEFPEPANLDGPPGWHPVETTFFGPDLRLTLRRAEG